jgi:hypothetical protein
MPDWSKGQGNVVPRRIEASDALAAVGALLVLVGLFLDWFGPLNAWEAFEIVDLLLALLAIGVILAAFALVDGFGPRAIAPLGVLLLLVIFDQLVEPPLGAPTHIGTGAWLALAGAALVAVGGALRVARVSVIISVGGRDVRRRVPAVDRRPAAGAAPPPPPPPPPPPGGSLLSDPEATQPFRPVDEG